MSPRQQQTRKQALEQASEPTSGSQSASKTKKTTTIGPYDQAFQQHLVQFGIYQDLYQYSNGTFTPRPENFDEIRQMMMQPRPSSPCRFSHEDFCKFQQASWVTT